jgi:hypothetical protein
MSKFEIEFSLLLLISCLVFLLLFIVFILYKYYNLKSKKNNEYNTLLDQQLHLRTVQSKEILKLNPEKKSFKIKTINFFVVLTEKLKINKSTKETELEAKNENISTKKKSSLILLSSLNISNEYLEIPDNENISNLNNKTSYSNFNYNNINNNNDDNDDKKVINKYGTTTNISKIEIELTINERKVENSNINKMFRFDYLINNLKNFIYSNLFKDSNNNNNNTTDNFQLRNQYHKSIDNLKQQQQKKLYMGNDGKEKPNLFKKLKSTTTNSQEILSKNNFGMKKLLSSTSVSPKSFAQTRFRRYSTIEENLSDKFWVPKEIALNSQQRCSLPENYTTINMKKVRNNSGNYIYIYIQYTLICGLFFINKLIIIF